MKSGINFLVCALLLLAVIACKDDDDPASPKLEGTWAMTGFEAEGTFSYVFLGQTLTADYTAQGVSYALTQDFEENPNTFTSQGTYSFAINTTLGGSPFSDTIAVPQVNLSGTWSLDGDILTQVANGDTLELEVITLTDTELVVVENRDGTFIIEGIAVDDQGQLRSTFRRQ